MGGRTCQSISRKTGASAHPSVGRTHAGCLRRLGPGNWVPSNQLDSPTAACVSPHAGVNQDSLMRNPIPLGSIIKGKSLSAWSACFKLRCTEQVMMQLWNVKRTHNGEQAITQQLSERCSMCGVYGDLSTLVCTCMRSCMKKARLCTEIRTDSSRGIQDRPGTDNNIQPLNVTQPTHTYTLYLLSNHVHHIQYKN